MGGVGVALYALSLVVQLVVEGQLRDLVGRRRMDKQISNMSGHVVVCGWGRVGRSAAGHLAIGSSSPALANTTACPSPEHAGADRIVNPQELGAARMASFVARPHIAEFVDVVMHERSLEFKMQELDVPSTSPLAGRTLEEADLWRLTGCLVLAIRSPDGAFNTNPKPETVIEPRHIVIAVGTDDDLKRLDDVAS